MTHAAQPQAAPAAPSGSTRRVTVVTPRARVDVALPPQGTLAELVPQLVRLAGAEGQATPDHPGWVLSRLGGAPLALGLTVSAAAVRDGEVLYLNPRERPRGPLLFDDVVDSIASAGQEGNRAWGPEAARRAGIAATVALLFGAALLVAVGAQGRVLAPVGCGLIAVLLLLAGGALSRAYGDSGAGAATAFGGFGAALLAGMASLPPHPVFSLDAGPLGAGLAAVTVYGVLAALSVADRLPWFVAPTVAALLSAVTVAVVLLADNGPAGAAAILAVLATALAAFAPMLALRLGRLPLPRVPDDIDAFRADEGASLGEAMTGQTRNARDLLNGLLIGLGLVVAGCSLVLLRSGSAWDGGMIALLALAWLLRSRSYAGTRQRAVVIGVGLVVLAVAGLWLAGNGERSLVLLAGLALLVAAAVCLVYAARVSKGFRSPYWARMLDIGEFLILLALIPVAGVIIDVYQAVRG